MVWFLSCFGRSEKEPGFCSSWSEVGYVFHPGSALILYLQGTVFFRISIGKFVALLKFLKQMKAIYGKPRSRIRAVKSLGFII